VSALARKADVKSRAADAAGSARQRAGEMAATAKAKAAGITGTAKSKAGTAKSRAGEVPGATKGAAAEVSGRALQLKDRAGPAQKRTLLLMALTAAVAAVLVTRARRDRSISRTRTGRSAGRTWAGRPIGRAWTHRPASRGWTRRSAGRAWTPRSISRALTGRPISPDWTDRVVSWVWTGSVTPDWTGRPVRRRSTHRARWYFQGFCRGETGEPRRSVTPVLVARRQENRPGVPQRPRPGPGRGAHLLRGAVRLPGADRARVAARPVRPGERGRARRQRGHPRPRRGARPAHPGPPGCAAVRPAGPGGGHRPGGGALVVVRLHRRLHPGLQRDL